MDNTTRDTPLVKGEKTVGKLTEYDLAEIFLKKCPLIHIDKELHYFDCNKNCYVRLDNKKLESLILSVCYSELKEQGNSKKIRDVAYLLRTRQGPSYTPGEAQGALGFQNGVLDLNTWVFSPCARVLPQPQSPISSSSSIIDRLNALSSPLPFRPITYCLPIEFYNIPLPQSINFNYAPAAMEGYFTNCGVSTPIADKFFSDISGGNQSLIRRIYEVIGYLIVPDTKAKAFFLLQGESNSGKSVFGKFLEKFFPKDRITSLDISRLGGQYLPEALYTSCLNLSMDLPSGVLSAKAIANLKMMTGDDLMALEAKYKDAKPYRGLCKFLFSTNHTLQLPNLDPAFLNRIICIPFEYSIPKQKQDSSLLDNLDSERRAIAAKALFYYRLFLRNNRQFSGNFPPRIDYNLSLNDTIKLFVEEECELVSVKRSRVHTVDLYKAYREFCIKNHYRSIDTARGFAQRLSELYYPQIYSDRWRDEGQNKRGFGGIRLKK